MSQTVVVRRVAATPARSAGEAWAVIVGLIASADSQARRELDGVAGIVMSLIADEAMRGSPIIVRGVGPRVRIYCIYDSEAILGEGVSEAALAVYPTGGEWLMSLPCPREDLVWVQNALATASTRITARDLAEPAPPEPVGAATQGGDDLGPLDVEAFLRP